MRRIELPDSINGNSGKDFAAMLEVGGGLRAYDVDFSFSAPAGTTAADEFFVHPLIAAQVSVDLIEQFTVRAAVDMGAFATSGDDQSYAFSITATFVWHPIKTVGVEIGYRDLAWSLESGSGMRPSWKATPSARASPWSSRTRGTRGRSPSSQARTA